MAYFRVAGSKGSVESADIRQVRYSGGREYIDITGFTPGDVYTVIVSALDVSIPDAGRQTIYCKYKITSGANVIATENASSYIGTSSEHALFVPITFIIRATSNTVRVSFEKELAESAVTKIHFN